MLITALSKFVFTFIVISFIIKALLNTTRLCKLKVFLECLALFVILFFETINTKLFNSAIKINYIGASSFFVELEQLWTVLQNDLDRFFNLFSILCIILSLCMACYQLKKSCKSKSKDEAYCARKVTNIKAVVSASQTNLAICSADLHSVFCRSNQ